MADGDCQRALLRRPGVHHHARRGGEHRRAGGIVELHALVLLEVAAHRRAVAVGLVDVRLVSESDGPAEPDVVRRLRGAHAGGVSRRQAGGRLGAEEPAGGAEKGVAGLAGLR
ncbi:MAG: hypothetical protein WCJ30_23605, partial [Deltaproteobacteria bacterium]